MSLRDKVQALAAQRPSKFGPAVPVEDGMLDGPQPVAEKPVESKPAQQPRHEPAQPVKANPAPDRAIPSKGSRTAPKRESTLDVGDGRSRRARGRNSRVSTNTLPEHCDALKIGADRRGLDFCVVLERLIEREFPDIVAERRKFYDEIYGRFRPEPEST